MLFLNSYTTANNTNKEIVDYYYEKIIKTSRNKVFYTKLMVPDTLDGRFDLLMLFSIILSFFLIKSGEKGKEISQVLFDKIFLDLDLTLREMGAGDTGVHVKIKKMIDAYMGRQDVYCRCLEKQDFKLFELHIINNIYRNVTDFNNSPHHLTNYCKLCFRVFTKTPIKSFLKNEFNFPDYKQEFKE